MGTNSSTPQPGERLAALKRKIADIRTEVAALRKTTSGIEASNWLSDQIDAFLTELADFHLKSVSEAARPASKPLRLALVAVGGNGRRRPCTFSDVDLLVLCDARDQELADQIGASIARDCWDGGLQVGHSVRSVADAVSFASEDVPFRTSLFDLRLVFGSKSLFNELATVVRQKVIRDHAGRLQKSVAEARADERRARGDSVNQLEPDIKKSPGGLRDLHLIRWMGLIRHDEPDIDGLYRLGVISGSERDGLVAADEFLTTLRFAMHEHAGRKQDVLSRDMQVVIARQRGFENKPGQHSVAVFMRGYFRHTAVVREVAGRIEEADQTRTFFSRIKNVVRRSPNGKGSYVMVGDTIDVESAERAEFCRDPQRVMSLFRTAAEREFLPTAELRRELRAQFENLPPNTPPPDDNIARDFRRILRSSAMLPKLLRVMYTTGVLEYLIPQFSQIRCLLQFNQYHSFTVDEHTLRAIEAVVSFIDDETPLGSAYRSVRHKATLHLAILLHDIGKGRDRDHSVLGAEITLEVAKRLHMTEHKTEMAEFLVGNHLVMSLKAFRRDPSDSRVLIDFARTVGTPEQLRMLYVLTAADIQAVGPGVWTDWKGELLADFYNRTMQILSGRPYNHLEQARLELVRDHVRSSIMPAEESLSGPRWREWIDSQLEALPAFYLMTEQPNRIARDLDRLQHLVDDQVDVEGSYEADTDTVEYRVFASGRCEIGSFHRIAGVLSAYRMDILMAQISTAANGTVIAGFRVADNDFTGNVPKDRIESVSEGIKDVLHGRMTVERLFRKSSLFRIQTLSEPLGRSEPHITIDNDCSESYTVIDVFAQDRPGLLYGLGLILHENRLSVQLARIATHVEQVVDVFYVLGPDGKKILDTDTLNHLRELLLQEIDEASVATK